MLRNIRCQGAILRDHHLLLIAHREHSTGRVYWLLPGGGMEPGETEEECLLREMREETGLEVRAVRLLEDDSRQAGEVYRAHKTYLCEIISGEPRPGYEPEPEVQAVYSIHAVAWIDLREPAGWGPAVLSDQITYPQLLRIRQALGYPPEA